MRRWHGTHALGRALILGTILIATSACGRFYWFKSAATQADSRGPDISDKPANEFAIGPAVRKRLYVPLAPMPDCWT